MARPPVPPRPRALALAALLLLGLAVEAPARAAAPQRRVLPGAGHAPGRPAARPARRGAAPDGGRTALAPQFPGLAGVAAGPEHERPFRVATLDPVRQVVDAPRPFVLDGAGLTDVAFAALYDATTGALAASLSASSIAPDRLVLDVPVGLAPGDHWLTLWSSAGALGWASIVFLDPALPRVEFVVPPIASATAPTAIAVHGAHLTGATRLLLEADGARLVGLGDLQEVSDDELHATVPAGLPAGTWRVRAVTRGGLSLDDVGLLVAAGSTPLPRVTGVAPYEVDNDADRDLVVAGEAFAGVLEVRAVGPVDLPLSFDTRPDGALDVLLPAATPAGLYDVVVRTPAGENAASQAKLLVVDPATAWDVLGDGRVVAVDPATVRLADAGAWGVVDGGRLRVLLDAASGAARVSDTGAPPADLGIEWEAQAPDAVAGAPGTTFAGVQANAGAAGVDFSFDHGGGELFRVTWGLGAGALEVRFSFDASAPGLPGNALSVALGALDLPAGHEQLAAAWGGVALRALDLLEPRTIAFPDHYDHPLIFARDPLAPAAGGLLVDLGPLGEQGSLRTVHTRVGDGATRVAVVARPALALRTGGALGPVRLSVEAGGWADAVEPLQAAVANPLRPDWIDDVSSVFRVVGLNGFSDADLLPALVEEVYAAVEAPASPPASTAWRLLHVVEPNEEGLAGVPDWTLSPRFALFAGQLGAAGWRVLPYLATPGLQDEHPLYPECSTARLGRWDKAAQQVAYRFWDADGSGTCCADPMDYWLMNVAHVPYRGFVLDALHEQRARAPFDGVYLDYMKANVRRDDRNPLGGDAVQGYRDMALELVGQLSQPGAPFLVAGEGSSVQLTEAGNALAAIHLVEPGLLEADPLGGNVPLHRAHPIGTHLTLDQTPVVTTSELAMPGWHPGQFHMVRLAEVAHGALPAAAAIGFGGWVQPSFGPEARRALVQVAEEGLWWSLHDVRPFTDPHPLWDDPETVRLFEVDGAVVARTREWVVRKTVCDATWRYGARGPTAAELDDLAARTDASFVGLFAAVCEVREHFRQAPTPAAEVRTRSAARAEVLAVMPDYPAP